MASGQVLFVSSIGLFIGWMGACSVAKKMHKHPLNIFQEFQGWTFCPQDVVVFCCELALKWALLYIVGHMNETSNINSRSESPSCILWVHAVVYR